MSLSPLVFTGVSQYSADFQTIVNRATQIANLPIKQLQNQQTDLVQQKVLVSNISSAVASLATSVSNLGNLGAQKALVALSSNTAKVTATNVNSSAPAVYTLSDITSVAKSAAESSLTGYTDGTTAAVSSTGSVNLIVGSTTHTIDLSTGDNLTALRDKINTLNAGVTATVLTTGTGPTPFYLSITANSTGATTLELRDDPAGANTNLLTQLNQGASTNFKINGVPVSKNTTLINDVVPGVTFNILGTTTGAETVSVTLASDKSKLSAALKDLVNNYNAVRDQVNAQVGKSAGLLSGDFLVRDVQSRLGALLAYKGTGSIKGLTDLGFEFDADASGIAKFNQTTFDALSDAMITDAFAFLGSTTSGFGAEASKLTTVSDAVSGLARIQIDRYEATDKRLAAQIAVLLERAADFQKVLLAKLQAADALLGGLTSQQNILTASLDSLNFSTYGSSNR